MTTPTTLQPFQWKIPARITCCGRSNSGKTTEFARLVSQTPFGDNFQQVWLLGPTAANNITWQKCKKITKVYPKFSEAVITEIYKKAESLYTQAARQGKKHNTLLILEDCGGEKIKKHGNYNTALDAMYMNCKNIGLSVAILVQNVNSLSIPAQENTDYLLLWMAGSETEQLNIYKKFGGGPKKRFMRLMLFVTRAEQGNYGYLFQDRTRPSSIQYYRKGYIKLDYDPYEGYGEEDFDENSSKPRKRKREPETEAPESVKGVKK